MLLDLPTHRITLLKEVAQHYPIFLLSNTNEIHINAFEEIIFNQHQLKSLDSLFQKVYYSSRLGLRKPNKEIFEFVLNEQNLNPETTLFIDDSIQHIVGASKLGIKAHFLEKDIDVSTLFKDGKIR
jgi:putative hydrolase of the HAD superfamily